MKGLLFAAAVLACTGDDGCGRKERHYTLKTWDGRVMETCAWDHAWQGSNCIQLYGQYGDPSALMCGVQSAEFGLPTPPPPAENPAQR